MEEFVLFILGMIAEALGLKKKKVVMPPGPQPSPRRAMASSPPINPERSQENRERSQTVLAMPRRPDAGGPLVLPGATTASFAVRERSLEAAEPTVLNAPPPLDMPPPSSAPPLFAGTDDFVRAFVLQEALGPPLCRRRPPP